MLEWLFERGMPCDSTHLISTIRNQNLEAVDQLLRHGVAAEQENSTRS